MIQKVFSSIHPMQGERVTLKLLEDRDASGLQDLVDNPNVYKYEPTFLFEKKYPDTHYVIEHLYDECLKDSIIMGVHMNDEFCGLIELYGYRDRVHKISVGYRLLESWWGMGIATETLGVMMRFLSNETDINYVTASTMLENEASAKVLKKNDFLQKVSVVDEDWGFDQPTIVNKWIRILRDKDRQSNKV